MKLKKAPTTLLFAIVILLTGLLLSSCESFDTGFIPSDEYLAKLKIGESSYEDAIEVLGLFQNYHPPKSKWRYFIRQEGLRISAFPYYIEERKIVALKFDDNNILAEIKKLSLDDSRNVSYETATTPETGVEKLNFIKEMISNIGRFNVSQ